MDGNEESDSVCSKIIAEYSRSPDFFDKQRPVSFEEQLALAENIFRAVVRICHQSGVMLEEFKAYDTRRHNLPPGYLDLHIELSPFDNEQHNWRGIRVAFTGEGSKRRRSQEWINFGILS